MDREMSIVSSHGFNGNGQGTFRPNGNLLEQTSYASSWSPPTPIQEIKAEQLPIVPMTPDFIPEPLRDWLSDTAERMQCPLDFLAVGAIVVASSLIGSGCSIRPKRKDSWSVIPNLWGGIVGPPSTLKSPALREILKPLETLESRARETYENDLTSYLVELEAHKATRESIKKKMAKAAAKSDTLDMETAKQQLRDLKEPEEPLWKRYMTNDVTIEKVHELLSQNERGLLLFRDELMGLLSEWHKDGHESDRTFYLEAWNGDSSKTTDRIGRGTIHTKNLCISILGSTQPTKLASYFQKTLNGHDNDGLLQRFQLLVYPNEKKDWTLIDRSPNTHAREVATKTLLSLAEMDFTEYGANLDEKSGHPYFRFNDPAQEIFYKWLTGHEHKLRTSSDEQILIEHFTKYRKLVPSLALIFHLIHNANGKTSIAISEECIEMAIRWSHYLESHARRIYENTVDTSYQAARKLANKIQNGDLNDLFNLRDVYRKEWSFLKDKHNVEAACAILITQNWIQEGEHHENGKTKIQYQVNPQVLQKRSASS